jgi:hypothetical protein
MGAAAVMSRGSTLGKTGVVRSRSRSLDALLTLAPVVVGTTLLLETDAPSVTDAPLVTGAPSSGSAFSDCVVDTTTATPEPDVLVTMGTEGEDTLIVDKVPSATCPEVVGSAVGRSLADGAGFTTFTSALSSALLSA